MISYRAGNYSFCLLLLGTPLSLVLVPSLFVVLVVILIVSITREFLGENDEDNEKDEERGNENEATINFFVDCPANTTD